MTLRSLVFGLAALTLSACSTSGSDADSETASPVPTSSAPTSAESIPPRTGSDEAASELRVAITVGELELTATLRDSPAVQDLLGQLPQTITMRDHGGVEKTGALSEALSIDDEPDGADPDPADLGYYAPGHDLVLYYGDQSYYPGIVILGALEGDLQRLGDLRGDLEIVVRAL